MLWLTETPSLLSSYPFGLLLDHITNHYIPTPIPTYLTLLLLLACACLSMRTFG